MAAVHSGWSRIRIRMAGIAAVLAVTLAAAAITTQRPIYALAAAAFTLIPVTYGALAATGRAEVPRALVAVGGITLVVVMSGAWISLRSCDNRLGPGASLEGCDFSNVALAHEALKGADLTGANLSGADLTSAELSNADASQATFSEATLRSADLSDAQLVGADLTGADLSFADLVGAELSEAILTDATLEDTELTEATFRGANLAGLDLAGASIPGSDLSGADLTDTVLDRAVLEDTRFAEATLDGASLIKASLLSADLTSASLVGADLKNANLTGADVTGADLSNASIDGALLEDVIGLDDPGLADVLDVNIRDLPETLAKRDIRIEPRPVVLDALGDSCRGGARGAAGASGGRFHPLVLLAANGDAHPFTDDVPSEWEPVGTRYAQFVVCVGKERRELVETCSYFNVATGAPVDPVRRFLRQLPAQVVDARTGKVVDQRTFSSEPVACSFEVFGFYDETIVGDKLDFNALYRWVGSFVR